MRDYPLKAATKLFTDFTGRDPSHVDIYPLPKHDTGLIVGACVGIAYEVMRDGKMVKYFHEFKKRAQPVLAASFDGSQLYLLGGNYHFTQRGIEDK